MSTLQLPFGRAVSSFVDKISCLYTREMSAVDPCAQAAGSNNKGFSAADILPSLLLRDRKSLSIISSLEQLS